MLLQSLILRDRMTNPDTVYAYHSLTEY